MTVTLEIPSEMEAQLSERAALHGQILPDYLLTLAEADIQGDYDLSEREREEEVAIIKQGLEDLHAGDKGILLEDYRAEVLAEYHRHKQQSSMAAG